MTQKKYKYENMSNEQVEVINKFTKYKSATAIQKRMGNLIEDEATLNNWIYDGFEDTGKLGNDHCSMGHALRYVHYAYNTQTGKVIKFGIKCISDFFSITPEKLKMIQQGFVHTNQIVDEIISKFNDEKCNKNVEEYKEKYSLLNEIPEHSKEINMLLDVDLPLPYKYEKEINSIWCKENSVREFSDFLDKNPEYCSIVVMANLLINDDNFKIKHYNIYIKINDIMGFLENHRRLSEAQINLLNKLLLLDFTETDELISELEIVPMEMFYKRGNYNEFSIFNSLKEQYNNWGLSDKQNELLKKIHNRNFKNIEKIKNQELLLAE